jgi:hypothetical protein
MLLGISVVDYASVVDHTLNGSSCILIDLPGTCWCQGRFVVALGLYVGALDCHIVSVSNLLQSDQVSHRRSM